MFLKHDVRTENGDLSTAPPKAVICTGDAATNWKAFKEAYEDYATTTELTAKDDSIQAVTLMTVMGKDCRQILLHLELSDGDKKKPLKILENCKPILCQPGTYCMSDTYSTQLNSSPTKQQTNT